MVCYIIQLPSNVNISLLSDLGISIRKHFSCVNCFVAHLERWQIDELENVGARITLDSKMRL